MTSSRVGELRAEPAVTAAAHELERHEREQDAAAAGDHRRLEQVLPVPQRDGEYARGGEHVREQEARQPHGEAGLQHQAVERENRQAVEAARGQPALAPDLHQDAFAVGLAVDQAQAPVDAIAIGRVAEKNTR